MPRISSFSRRVGGPVAEAAAALLAVPAPADLAGCRRRSDADADLLSLHSTPAARWTAASPTTATG